MVLYAFSFFYAAFSSLIIELKIYYDCFITHLSALSFLSQLLKSLFSFFITYLLLYYLLIAMLYLNAFKEFASKMVECLKGSSLIGNSCSRECFKAKFSSTTVDEVDVVGQDEPLQLD